MGACLLGGFFGCFLVDSYALPFATFLGNFRGVRLLASALLFLGALIVTLVPGYFLSRIGSKFFLGFIDSVIGILAGGMAGVVVLGACLLALVPLFPSVERGKVWKKSALVRPLHDSLEDFFSNPRYGPSPLSAVKEEAFEKLAPVAKETKEKVTDAAQDWVQKIKK